MTPADLDGCPRTPMMLPKEQQQQECEREAEAEAEDAGFRTPPGTGLRAAHSVGGSGHTYHTHARRRQSQKPRVLAVLGDPEPEEGQEGEVEAEAAAVATPGGSVRSENQEENDGEEDEEEDRDCPICYSPFVNRSVHRTRCQHLFHKSCFISSRAAHINGCPCCRGQITPGLTPFDAQPGRNNLASLPGNDRNSIASRARAARQAVMARMARRAGGAAGGAGDGGGGAGQDHMRPRCVCACMYGVCPASPTHKNPHNPHKRTAAPSWTSTRWRAPPTPVPAWTMPSPRRSRRRTPRFGPGWPRSPRTPCRPTPTDTGSTTGMTCRTRSRLLGQFRERVISVEFGGCSGRGGLARAFSLPSKW